MNMKEIDWAIRQPVSGIDKLTLIILASKTDPDCGICFTNISDLSFTAGVGKSTIQKALKRLISEGYVIRKRIKEGSLFAGIAYMVNHDFLSECHVVMIGEDQKNSRFQFVEF